MDKLIDDLRFSLRLLAKTPGFSFLCLLIVVLGMTISLYTFTLVYEFTSRPPPFPDGERFAVVKIFSESTNNQQRPTANAFTFNRLNQTSRSFSELGLFFTDQAIFTDGESARGFYAGVTTPNVLSMTHVTPHLGRGLNARDAVPGAAPVVLLGYDLWQSYFAGDPSVIGSQTQINGSPRTIVGVMPKNFQVGLPHELWLPLPAQPAATVDQPDTYELVGVLEPGSSFESASWELSAILTDLAAEFPETYQGLYSEVQPIGLIDSTGQDSISMMYAICVLVILLGAINLSSLLFVRASTRQRELAVRSAVGANRWELNKQVLLESLVLCVVGTVIAVALADFLLRTIEFDNPINPMGKSWRDLRIHGNGLLVALGLMIVIWLSSTLVTAIRVSRQDTVTTLEGTQQGGSSRLLNAATKTVIGIEIVLAFFLLVLCGTITFAIVDKFSYDYGAMSADIVTGDISLRDRIYRDSAARHRFIGTVLAELQSSPLIENASISTAPPGSFAPQRGFRLEDRDFSPNESLPSASVVWVSPNYFSEMDVRIVEGREFTATDDATSQAVVVVDERFAHQYWPNESPIGKRIQLSSGPDAEWLTVVGMNSHIAQGLPIDDYGDLPSIYRPIYQATPGDFSLLVEVTANASTSDATRAIRNAVAKVDRGIPVTSIYRLDYVQKADLTSVAAIGQLMSFIALSVLGLSLLGIYGIISRSVVLRAGEIGIRRALGSNSAKVLVLFLRQACVYLVVGILLGASSGVIVSASMTQLAPNILDYVPVVFCTVLVSLGGLVLLASYLPVKRILNKEPGDALRVD